MKRVLAAMLLPLVLGGCVVSSNTFGNGLTSRSALGVEGVELRRLFLVARLDARTATGYRVPIACRYRMRHSAGANERSRGNSARITLNAHNGNTLSYVELNGRESTASMDGTGFVRQFNAQHSDGERIVGWQPSSNQSASVSVDAAPVPEITMLLPQYTLGTWVFGDTVATLYNARHEPVGEYLYRGIVTDYSDISRDPGRRFAALDLVTGENGKPFDRNLLRVIRGFAIIDLDTMLPATFAYSQPLGGEMTLQLRECE